jgi:hypothetical protein
LNNKSFRRNSKSKTLATLAITILLLSTAMTLLSIPTASGHAPAWEIPTYAFVNVAPNPAGVGQQCLVVVWLDKMPDGTLVTNNIRFHNYKVIITAPDGTKTDSNMGNSHRHNILSVHNLYTNPDWHIHLRLQLPRPEIQHWHTGVDYNANSQYVNDTYMASSASTTLIVQEEPAPSGTYTPLPTEYWTRPIEGQNANWYAIGSNYLYPMGAAYSFGSVRYQADGTAPDSGHVLWSKPITFGGIVGGNNEYRHLIRRQHKQVSQVQPSTRAYPMKPNSTHPS